jgi:hypothetical protein
MNKPVDTVVKLTISAKSKEEAEMTAKSERGFKEVVGSEITTSIFEVTIIKEKYGDHDLGWCDDCGESLCFRLEVYSGKCDDCM